MIYVRWRKGESRRGRVFPEAGAASDLPCPFCTVRLGDDPPIQLIAVGPEIDDPEAVRKYAEGRWHTATAVALHADCAAEMTDDALEVLISELVLVGGPDG
jgi:hypothetical protein